jgi:hypothetical protein
MCINQCVLLPQYKGNISHSYIQIKNATPFGVAQQTTTLFYEHEITNTYPIFSCTSLKQI